MIERKDVWKTEGFPIWRIETGKLLQKFDPVLADSGVIHKSASVVSELSVVLTNIIIVPCFDAVDWAVGRASGL